MIIIPSKRLNSSIWPISGIQTGTNSLGQSEPESNGDEKVFHVPQTPRWEPCHQIQFNVIHWIPNFIQSCIHLAVKIAFSRLSDKKMHKIEASNFS